MKSTSRFSRTLFKILAPALAVGMFLFSGSTVRADSVTTTVTAVGKKEAPPEIKKDDVKLYSGKEQMQVANWRRGDTLFIAVLIDDSLDPRLAQNFNDLKAFFMAQPQTTYIAVAYSRNGTAAVVQDFTNDHALAAKSLRLPLGAGGAFTSPYLSVQDWMKRWPDNGGDRRSIIMISSGIDYFRGSFDPVDPDLDSTISRAQKQNINVWTVYYPGPRSPWPPPVPRFQCAIEPEPPLGRNRRRIVLPQHRLSGFAEAVLRRDRGSPQESILAHV